MAIATLAYPSVAEEAVAGRQIVCQAIADAAAANGLPASFLTRLLWTESGFRSEAVSPAGAIGVAQFMPQTALEQNLADPREPVEAVHHAARLLTELARQFGNLGLAAAAYNAGAARVTKWLRGQSTLPLETELYVRVVTGRPAVEWATTGGALAANDNLPASGLDCLNLGIARAAPASAYRPAVWQSRLDTHLATAIDLYAAVLQADLLILPLPRRIVRANVNSLCAAVRARGLACEVFER